MWVTVYTDASFKDGKGGWGVWLRSEQGRLVRSGNCPVEIRDSTGAEMYAALVGLDLAIRMWPETRGVLMNSDCLMVVDCLLNQYRDPIHARLQRAIREKAAKNNVRLQTRPYQESGWAELSEPAGRFTGG